VLGFELSSLRGGKIYPIEKREKKKGQTTSVLNFNWKKRGDVIGSTSFPPKLNHGGGGKGEG